MVKWGMENRLFTETEKIRHIVQLKEREVRAKLRSHVGMSECLGV